MTTTDRLPPALCVDCGHPISERAIRCRRCAARARAGFAPASPPGPASAERPPPALPPEDVAWLRAHGRRYNAARLAQVFGVPVEEIRALLNGAGTG